MRYNATLPRKEFLAEAIYEPVMVANIGIVQTWSWFERIAVGHWRSEKELLVSSYPELFRTTTDWVEHCIGRAPVRQAVRIYMLGTGLMVCDVPCVGIFITADRRQQKEYAGKQTLMARAHAKTRAITCNKVNDVVDNPMRLSAPALRMLEEYNE